ncbi:MAG: phosphotransferase [Ilumatobacteraceae bacterium]
MESKIEDPGHLRRSGGDRGRRLRAGVPAARCTELTDGYFNAAYRLDLDDGTTWVLKVAPPGVEVLWYEHDILHAEIDALRLVRDHTDAPVPDVVWVDEATRLPSPSFVMSYVPGVSLAGARDRLTTEALADLDATIGGHLAQVHTITSPTFGLLSPARPAHTTWRAAFGEIVEFLLLDGERAGVVLPVGYDELRSALVSCSDALDEVAVANLVLWDLWDGNVLVHPDTGRLGGYLDFERALWGDPLLEFQFGPHGRATAVAAGYGRDLLDSPGAGRRRTLYSLYHHLVLSIEGAYRQYPADPLGDLARAGLRADLDAMHRT